VRKAGLSVLVAAAAAWLALAVASAQAQGATPAAERTIKAAFLYKFAGYVEWPEAAGGNGPITIGVLGSEEMAGELARITAGRTVNERPVQVRRLAAGESPAGLQVVFVGKASGESLDMSLSALRGLPILVVTDSPGALASGSMINFTFDRDRVRFEVSLPAAERSRLKLSSRLLAVAQRVQRTPDS
jgi:hypothetical protein